MRVTISETLKDKLAAEEFIAPRPTNPQVVRNRTKFSDDEIKKLYHFFKKLCPPGVLTEKRLKRIYSTLFPRGGDSDEYAHFIFKAIDRNQDGVICFEDIAETYSILSRGTTAEKLGWVFDFYDVNKTGKVGQLDMLKVVKSFYDLLDPDSSPDTVFSLVNAMFWKIVKRGERNMSKDEFVNYCLQNPNIVDGIKRLQPLF